MALSGISFEVKKGEAVGIIGHNGAGKSTLLKLITQVTAPTSGAIYLNGRVASMLEVGTGFHPELTGRENIYVNGAILGMTKKEIDSKIEEIIDFSECRQFIDTPVKRYSSGMYVKLAFSVAAHLDSEIMIMDEVLAVGDARFQEKCIDKMREVAYRDGRTVLYVSHNMSTIRKLCNRCIVLDKGKIRYQGNVEHGISLYLDMSSGIEDLPINLKEKNRHGEPSGKIQFTEIDFIGKTNTGFAFREDMKVKVVFNAEFSCDKFYIRFHIKRSDGVCLGIKHFEPINIHSGINEVLFNMDFRELISGKYSITLIGYELNAYGTENLSIGYPLGEIYILAME
jgi:lipopolysaccharide transport system ATP-binding protein